MRYRALFIGGSVDGQERLLNDCPPTISVPVSTPPCVSTRCRRAPVEIQQYTLLLTIDTTLLYSTDNVEETLNRLWNHYTGDRYV